jgi:hypothetical protein
MMNTSPRSVNRAKKVITKGAKELVQAVESAAVPVSLAAKLIDECNDIEEQARIARQGKEAIRKALAVTSGRAGPTRHAKESEAKSSTEHDYQLSATLSDLSHDAKRQPEMGTPGDGQNCGRDRILAEFRSLWQRAAEGEKTAIRQYLLENDNILLGYRVQASLDEQEQYAVRDITVELFDAHERKSVRIISLVREAARRIGPKLDRLAAQMPMHPRPALELSVARRAVYYCLEAYERNHHVEAVDHTEGIPKYEAYGDGCPVRFWRDDATSSSRRVICADPPSVVTPD